MIRKNDWRGEARPSVLTEVPAKEGRATEPDAERRLMFVTPPGLASSSGIRSTNTIKHRFITDLDDKAILALASTASIQQAQPLRRAIQKHLAFSASIDARFTVRVVHSATEVISASCTGADQNNYSVEIT